jgi:hypothetical protein
VRSVSVKMALGELETLVAWAPHIHDVNCCHIWTEPVYSGMILIPKQATSLWVPPEGQLRTKGLPGGGHIAISWAVPSRAPAMVCVSRTLVGLLKPEFVIVWSHEEDIGPGLVTTDAVVLVAVDMVRKSLLLTQ